MSNECWQPWGKKSVDNARHAEKSTKLLQVLL